MSILQRPARSVKPSRRTPAPRRPFGQGLMPDRMLDRREPYTAADLAAAHETSPFRDLNAVAPGDDPLHDRTVSALAHWSEHLDPEPELATTGRWVEAGYDTATGGID